jgi:hypothetical protein
MTVCFSEATVIQQFVLEQQQYQCLPMTHSQARRVEVLQDSFYRNGYLSGELSCRPAELGSQSFRLDPFHAHAGR